MQNVVVAADEAASATVTDILKPRTRDENMKTECTDDVGRLVALFRQQPPDLLIIYPERFSKAALRSLGLLENKQTVIIAVLPEKPGPAFRLLQRYPVRWYLTEGNERQDLSHMIEEAEEQTLRQKSVKNYSIQQLCEVQNEYRMIILAEFDKEMNSGEFKRFLRFFSRTDFRSSVFPYSPRVWALFLTQYSEKEARGHISFFLKHFQNRDLRIRFAVSGRINHPGELMKKARMLSTILKLPAGKSRKRILRESEFSDRYKGDVRPSIFIACRYVQKHFNRRLKLEEIAEQCFLTSNYLSEIFKEDMGMTLTDYIEQIRMSHAVQALVDGRDPIKDIAVMCGYRSASYFCKRFKDTYGIPATQYRKEESDARRHRVNQVNVLL